MTIYNDNRRQATEREIVDGDERVINRSPKQPSEPQQLRTTPAPMPPRLTTKLMPTSTT